jgi:hypothetical protein
MAVEVNLETIIEALELADDSISSFLDVETGEVQSITAEEFDLAEDPETDFEDLPDWQRDTVKLARIIQQNEDRRYLALPDKFHIHEWAIMDRFSESLNVARLRNDLHAAIRGAGAFRLFKHLLTEYNLWDAWISSKRSNFDRSLCDGVKSTALSFAKTQP